MYIPDRAERRYAALISGEMQYCFGKSSPSSPDYVSAAEATAAGNLELLEQQTQNNRPDQIGPGGSVRWEQDADGNWTQNTALTEDGQRGFEAGQGLGAERSEMAEGMFGQVQDAMSQPMDWRKFSKVGDGSGAYERGSNALYGKATSRLDPRWEKKNDQQLARLAAQGLRPGDKAYDDAVAEQGMQETDAYAQAQYNADIAGGQEGQRQFNMETADRNRQIKEEMSKRTLSLDEINKLMAGQGVNANPNLPGFTEAGRGTGTDYSSAASDQYSADANRASQNNANAQGYMSAAALMMCDRRLKRNITRIGSFKQYPLYLFQYIWGQWAIGPMADEVNQDAVTRLPNGYDMVDLARVV